MRLYVLLGVQHTLISQYIKFWQHIKTLDELFHDVLHDKGVLHYILICIQLLLIYLTIVNHD